MNRKFILIILCCLLLSCSETQPTEQNIIIVKVPPFYNEKLSQVENYWHFQRFLFPQQEIPNPLPKDLPHDHSLLFVSIDETGKLTLNSEDEGNVSDTNFMLARLSEIFREREKAGVYEPGKWKIVKAVGVRAAHSIKYGDFIRSCLEIELKAPAERYIYRKHQDKRLELHRSDIFFMSFLRNSDYFSEI